MADFELPIAAADWHTPVELIQLGQNLGVERTALPFGEAVPP